MDAIPMRGGYRPVLLKKALQTGKSWRTLLNEGADGIGTHELGHQIVFGLKISPLTNWQNELLASYIGYAYLQAKHPDEVLANEFFGAHQCAVDQRVIEVYRQSRLNSIKQMQQAFPPNRPDSDTNAVLDKLESLNPGWKAWAKQIESGQVRIVE